MINMYLNRMINDFEVEKWDPRLKNHDDSSFPLVVSDKLEIKPFQDKSEYLIFANKHKANMMISRRTPLKEAWLLPRETKMVFALYLNYKLSSSTISSAKSIAQRALSILTLKPYLIHELTQSKYLEFIDVEKSTNLVRFNDFISWCVSKQYCEGIRTQELAIWDTYDGAKRIKEKLPEVSSIIALGDIFCQTIPENKALWNISANSKQANAIASMYSALCLASPNRMCAEIITLQRQNLLKFEVIKKDDKSHNLYSLIWQGSKKYKDNENHIGGWMVEQINRGIEYFDSVTYPYRILAEFWVNQDSTIKMLFPAMNATVKKRLIKTKLSLTSIPSFIQLGYLLGFYESENFQLNIKGREKQKSNIHISMLDKNFRVYCSGDSGVGELLGFSRLSPQAKIFVYGNSYYGQFHSIKELQLSTFQAFTKTWASFPYLSMGDGRNKRHITSAMWCFNGASIGREGGFYQLVSASTIEGLIKRKLTRGELLKDFGFSARLKVTPHMLRHYMNHHGYINGIPDYILNIWSGRHDSKHLLHYIHEEDEDKLARIPMLTEQVKLDNIKVSSEVEFANARGGISGSTSRTSVGFCSKDLRFSPCQYLSKFETQCTFCEHSCHIAHDEVGIKVLKEDYEIQCERLDNHLLSPKRNNENARNWFKMHKANVYLLEQLIETLEDKSIDAGSIIRVITDNQQIRIADLKKQRISHKQLRLDIMDENIQAGLKLLNYKPEPTDRDIEMKTFIDDLWSHL
ncbi:hypothetical protein [Motilimonas sp. E26]|uniref:hypothetical protein n=1 Tax=Motilimonas sp. E26 TaxID=2865674 RepID=UPI001E30B6F2|nr:hypothetical protein [Motilimonas sp. E26]MCE0558263.1 hypothetical protein [Motilimonas sp. E26]